MYFSNLHAAVLDVCPVIEGNLFGLQIHWLDEEKGGKLWLESCNLLNKNSQQEVSTTELNYLWDPTGKPAPNRVQTLDLFLDEEGLIHSGGRLDKSSQFTYKVKNPLLLGKNHHLTQLIILDCHLKCSHLGVGLNLTELRCRGYWVPLGRQAVKRALNSFTKHKI